MWTDEEIKELTREIKAGNEHYTVLRAKYETELKAFGEALTDVAAAVNRIERSGGGVPQAVTAAGLDGKHDFLFGEKVRRKALEGKAISSETGPYGGYLLTSDQDAFYAPLLVAQSVSLASGIAFIPTGSAEIKMPVEGDDPVAYWTGEGEGITESTPVWNLANIAPRKLASLVAVPNEMLAAGETSPYIGRIVERRVGRAMSGELDRVIFEGNGLGQPLGMKNTPNINEVSMGDNGATFTNLDPFADAIGELAIDNCEAKAIVMHPRDWKNLLKLKEQTSSNNKPLLQESAGSGSQGVKRSIYGVPVFLTSRLSTTETQGSATSQCSSAYVYDPMWLAFAQRQALQIAVDGSRLFNQDKSEIRAILRGNLVTMQASAICRIKGIKAS